MSESTRTRRSPQEILAAKETDLANARARAAVDAQMSNPAVQSLTATITGISKARTDAKKGYNGNPNQTFENRTQSHTLWIEEIQAEKELADAEIALADYIGPQYRELRSKVAQALADGKDVTGMVTLGVEAIETSAMALQDAVSGANSALAIATAARKAFLASKKPQAVQAAS